METEDLLISAPVFLLMMELHRGSPSLGGCGSRERRSTPARGLRERALWSGKRDNPGAKTPLAFCGNEHRPWKTVLLRSQRIDTPHPLCCPKKPGQKRPTLCRSSMSCAPRDASSAPRWPVFPSLTSEGRLRLSNTGVRPRRLDLER